MFVLCVCPTYGRPQELIENTIWLFEQQTHPERYLILYDDLGNIGPQRGLGWEVVSTPNREKTLPAKYNWILNYASEIVEWQAVAQWDDDDIYLPNHVEKIAYGCQLRSWCYPTVVGTTYDQPAGSYTYENTRVNFSASLGVDRYRLEKIGNWPDTPEMDFDQQLLKKLNVLPAHDTSSRGKNITYIMRWSDSGASHCSAPLLGSDWYDDYRPGHPKTFSSITPCPDYTTKIILDQLDKNS